MRVGHHHRVKFRHPGGVEHCHQAVGRIGGAGVDQAGIRPARNQHAVTLADIEKGNRRIAFGKVGGVRPADRHAKPGC